MIVTQSYIVTIMHRVFKQLVIKTKKKVSENTSIV